MTELNTQMSGESLSIAEQRKQELKQLFPGVFTEIKNDKGEIVEAIDYERLKAELGNFSEIYDNRRERYGMDWPGKRDCLRLIQEPSRATLKPCRDESVEFDKTENLFIEGDNLEVLKLLQKAYYGKVKMIYIDPPYNTGKEFIYPDNFSESLETYLSYAGLSGDDGKKFSTNSANEGRFHTKWLNMMFPRLYLARNLLRDDGVIFISIDDNEVENLRFLCNEIFGEENYLGLISRATGTRMGSGSRGIAKELDYILVFSRNTNYGLSRLPTSEDDEAIYNEKDARGKYLLRSLRRTGGENRREDRPTMFYAVKSPDGEDVFPLAPEGWESRWVCSYETYLSLLEDDMIEWKLVEKAGVKKWQVYQKHYLSEDGRECSDLWSKEDGNKKATREVNALFGGNKVFDHPKPIGLLKKIIALSSDNGDIVLDFFAGTSSLGHAVSEYNCQNNKNIKYVLVQLPEEIDPNSVAAGLGIKTVADIGKRRLRLAAENLNKENLGQLDFEGKGNLDLGFKVLKLDRSNFKHWQAPAKDIADDELAKQFELHIDHIDPNASQEDILYELLIKAGVMPTEKIELIELANHAVFSVGEGGWLICLQDTIEQSLIDAVLAKEPVQFICLDRAFHGNDQLKANAIATFADFNQGRDKADQIEFRTV
jgi:adenine-specific DNA-methyltransferase